MEIKNVLDKVAEIDGKLSGKLTEIEAKMAEGNFATPEQVNEIKSLVDAANAAAGETRSSIEKLETEFKKAMTEKRSVELKSASDYIAAEIMEKKELFHSNMSASMGKLFEVKSGPAVMTFGSSATGKPSVDLRTEIVGPIRRRTHIRELLPMGVTSAQLYQYIQEDNATQEGTALGQVEGADKAFIQMKIAQKDAKVDTLAAFVRVSRQMLDDVVGLSSYLGRRLPQEILLREDLEVLNGTGSNPFTYTGIKQNAETAPNLGAKFSNHVAQEWDVLLRAAASQKALNFEVNGILLNPADFGALTTVKGVDGQYVAPVQFVNNQVFLRGIPVFESSAVEAGKYFLGDWTQAEMVMREGLSVGFFEQDQDNVIKNLVTVRGEERFALPIYQPKAFIFGDFAAGIAALNPIASS